MPARTVKMSQAQLHEAIVLERPHPIVIMTKEDKEQTVIEQMKLFNQDPTTFEDEKYQIQVGEYKGYIRRTYLQKNSRPISKYEVEYRMELSRDGRTVRARDSWGAWIYIQRPDYLNYGNFKPIKDTEYGVHWY